jgi:hypothetical protein
MGRRWIVEVEGKEHEVEAKYGTVFTSGSGEVLVDGQLIDSWGSSLFGLPKERTIEIAGQKATIRRVGTINQDLDLLIPNAKVRIVK